MDFKDEQEQLEYDIHLMNQQIDRIAENINRMARVGEGLIKLQQRLSEILDKNKKEAA